MSQETKNKLLLSLFCFIEEEEEYKVGIFDSYFEMDLDLSEGVWRVSNRMKVQKPFNRALLTCL